MTAPVKTPLARLGAVDLVLRAVESAVARASGGRVRLIKYHLMAQPVRVHQRAIPSRAGGVAVDEIHADDPRIAAFPRPPEEIAHRFASGARCFAAWHEETFAGFLWFVEGRYDEHEARCTFRLDPADHAVWDFDVTIVPRFRNGRAFALLWQSALEAMRARGARWSISRVSAFNLDSIRAHERMGSRRTGWALFVLSGSLHFTLTSLGQIRWRRLEHGPYPAIDVRAPAASQDEPSRSPDSTTADERLPRV